MATSRRQKRNAIDYSNPPLIEVVYGVKFTPLKGWMLPHIGAFWQALLDEFPQCEHVPPIRDSDFTDPATGLPLPRVWLISATEDRLVQLQPGRFLFNWRHRAEDRAYPRYAQLSREFFELFEKFHHFVDQHDLGDMEVVEYELTYINHIAEQQGWRFPESTGKILPQLAWGSGQHGFLPHPTSASWQANFALDDEGSKLLVKLNPARRREDDKPLLILELSARGLPEGVPLDNIEGWFSRAHEWIVNGFEDLTSQTAQKQLWGRNE